MAQAFTRDELASLQSKLQREGHLFNARVTCVTDVNSIRWTVKDFSSRPWYVKLITRFLLARELKALNRLKGLEGFASDAFRIDRDAIAIRFIPGKILSQVDPGLVSVEFLERLESLTFRMHEAGIVHLDIRSMSNILMQDGGRPAIIDFQAAICTDHLPNCIRKALEDFDLSGSYKKWLRFQPEAMGEIRRKELDRINKVRKLWILRGYFGWHH